MKNESKSIFKLVITICLLYSFTACDSPIRSRDPYAPAVDTSNIDTSTSEKEKEKETDKEDNTKSQSEGIESDVADEGFEDCNLGAVHYEEKIGNFGLCQSTKDEKVIKIKMQNADSSNGTCFVPIHVNSDGSSYHLGPAECVHHEADKEYTATLNKDRSENINGIMVLKANSLNGYMQCMSAKYQYINNYYNCNYNQTCLNSADQWAYQVCLNFTQVYDGYFFQVNL